MNTFKKDSKILNREMSNGDFLKVVLLTSLVCVLLVIGINAWIDIYGLFRPVTGRNLPVYNNERVSKYLLSYHYIPKKFNVAIMGTSLSANLDISECNRGAGKLKIYNASVMGANISELTPIAERLIKGGIKNMIICFSPYMVKTSGNKEVTLDKKLFYGALGSKNLYDTYVVGLIRYFELIPHKFPKNQINEFGVNQYDQQLKVENIKEKIALVIEENKNGALTINPLALDELKKFISLLRKNKINFLGYIHPLPKEIFESKRRDYERFEKIIRELVQDDSKLIDFNEEQFKFFTEDYTNYIDHAHLSKKGVEVITKALYAKMTDQVLLKEIDYLPEASSINGP